MKCAWLLWLSLAVGGCANSVVQEQHLLQCRDDLGRVQYYRVTIRADAADAAIKLRAGMFDVNAVDEIIDGRPPREIDADAPQNTFNPINVTDPLHVAQGRLIDQYASAISATRPAGASTQPSGVDPNIQHADEVWKRVERLRQDSSSFRRDQKFVLIYSALAGVIANSLAEYAEEEKTKESLGKLWAILALPEYERSLERLTDAKLRLTSLLVPLVLGFEKFSEEVGDGTDAAKLSRALNSVVALESTGGAR